MRISRAAMAALLIGIALPAAAPQEPEPVEVAVQLMSDARLMRALRRNEGDPAEVSAAFQAAVDPNSRDERFSVTALYRAVPLVDENQSELDILKFLIDAGADMHARSFGRTPLDEAALFCAIGSAQLLIASGANVNARDNDGRTPLHRACASVAELLIAAGANAELHDSDNHGHTPLHLAAFHCRGDAAKAMIVEGADLHVRDDQGNTPLHSATCTETVWALFDASAGPNAHNDDGEIPAEPVSRVDWMAGYQEAAQLLRRMAGR